MKINNLTQLAEMVGAAQPTVESISRRIYKDTICGAWVDAQPIGVRKIARFKVVFSDSIFGPVAHQWQCNGRGAWHNFGEAITPVELKEFIGGQEPKLVGPYKYDWHNMLKVEEAAGKNMAEVHTSASNVKWLPRKPNTGWVELPVTVYKQGVRVGSIVEGSDACTEVQELTFPFTEREFWAAVKQVEEEAEQLWQEANCEEV